MTSTMSNEIFIENGSNHLSRMIRDEPCKFVLESTRAEGESRRDNEKKVAIVRRYVPKAESKANRIFPINHTLRG